MAQVSLNLVILWRWPAGGTYLFLKERSLLVGLRQWLLHLLPFLVNPVVNSATVGNGWVSTLLDWCLLVLYFAHISWELLELSHLGLLPLDLHLQGLWEPWQSCFSPPISETQQNKAWEPSSPRIPLPPRSHSQVRRGESSITSEYKTDYWNQRLLPWAGIFPVLVNRQFVQIPTWAL